MGMASPRQNPKRISDCVLQTISQLAVLIQLCRFCVELCLPTESHCWLIVYNSMRPRSHGAVITHEHDQQHIRPSHTATHSGLCICLFRPPEPHAQPICPIIRPSRSAPFVQLTITCPARPPNPYTQFMWPDRAPDSTCHASILSPAPSYVKSCKPHSC